MRGARFHVGGAGVQLGRPDVQTGGESLGLLGLLAQLLLGGRPLGLPLFLLRCEGASLGFQSLSLAIDLAALGVQLASLQFKFGGTRARPLRSHIACGAGIMPGVRCRRDACTTNAGR